jgi:Spy/CpxP family protein refolding chaperone
MRKLLVVAAALTFATLAGTTSCYALLERRPPPPPEVLIEQWKSLLSLTDAQVEKIETIFADAKAGCESQESKEDVRSCMRSQEQIIKEKLLAVLTDEQRAKLQSKKDDPSKELDKICRDRRREKARNNRQPS